MTEKVDVVSVVTQRENPDGTSHVRCKSLPLLYPVSLVQLIEPPAHNREVVGLSPTGHTNNLKTTKLNVINGIEFFIDNKIQFIIYCL